MLSANIVTFEQQKNVFQMNNYSPSNDEKNYLVIVVGVLIGLFGIYLRFFGDSLAISIIANVCFILGALICLRTVFAILK